MAAALVCNEIEHSHMEIINVIIFTLIMGSTYSSSEKSFIQNYPDHSLNTQSGILNPIEASVILIKNRIPQKSYFEKRPSLLKGNWARMDKERPHT